MIREDIVEAAVESMVLHVARTKINYKENIVNVTYVEWEEPEAPTTLSLRGGGTVCLAK